jgi:hypothetical protein
VNTFRNAVSCLTQAMQNHFVLEVTWIKTLRELFICLRPPPLLGFCLGMGKYLHFNFVGSEFGHRQSVEVVQYMVSRTIPPGPHTVYCTVYIYLVTDGGGGELHWR